MLKCKDCGHIFEDGEQKKYIETHGFENPPFERFEMCPVCSGSFGEATYCEKCDTVCLVDEMQGDICNDCIEKEKYNIDLCYKSVENEKAEIKINPFIAMMFTEQEINQILFDILKNNAKDEPLDCSIFIEEYPEYFSDASIKEGK